MWLMKIALPVLAIAGIIALLVWRSSTHTHSRPQDSSTEAPPSDAAKTPRRTRPRTTTPQKLTKEEADNRPGVQRDKAVASIRQHFAAQRYDAVIAAANMLLESGDDDVTAHLYLAMAACGLGDGRSAIRHWGELPPERRTLAERKCEMLGIDIAE